MAERPRFDVVVVGGGPAGIAAACAAAECGRRVALLDQQTSLGGQIWRDAAVSRKGRLWLARLRGSGAQVLRETCVIDRPEPGTLLATTAEAPCEIEYERLILATGARERLLPFPGWTLLNVVGAGGLAMLVKGGLPVRGKRVVVAGTGPLLVTVAAFLRRCGAVVPLIAEQASLRGIARFALAAASPARFVQALGLAARLAGSRYLWNCRPVAAEGGEAVEAVILRRYGKSRRVPCDYLACGFGLVPNLELALLSGCALRDGFVLVDEWQQTSAPGIYAAGELTGVGGAEAAVAEGRIAGYAAAGDLERARRGFRARRRARRLQAALATAFALGEELRALATPETIVCRCEDVRLRDLAGQDSWRSAKLLTRCGMGACQGRVCGPITQYLFGWEPASVRPPLFPARVDSMCATPERRAAQLYPRD